MEERTKELENVLKAIQFELSTMPPMFPGQNQVFGITYSLKLINEILSK